MAQATQSAVVEAQEDLVRERVSRLLAEIDVERDNPKDIWGKQFDLGLAWVHFPEGLGGLGVRPDLQSIVEQAMRDAGAPHNWLRNPIGLGMAAPVILAHGSQRQKERYLRPLFTCEEVWCQLFSEPGAGSDVASLATRAVRDGDEWVVNGQKVWTTLAHRAAFGLLLARTDPDVPKHQGMTYFVLDMHAPGVEVRPLVQMTGEAEFNEVFMTDARIPDNERLGEVGDGWRVAITTLMNERVAIGGAVPPRGSGAIADAVRVFKEHNITDRSRRDRLMRLWIEAETLRLTNARARQLREAGTPGPEGSVGKLIGAELNQKIYELTTDLMGMDATLYQSGYTMARPEEVALGGRDPVKLFLRSRANSIEGGTSEIMRNILGERVLGLPREPRDDSKIPWSQLPRS